MLLTAIVQSSVTPEGWDDFVHSIKARDQRRQIQIGDVISHYYDEEMNQQEEVEVTIWHNYRRAAVCYFDGDSEWGNWDEVERAITLDEPDPWGRRVKLDRYGRRLG